jgi:hypothetical protein
MCPSAPDFWLDNNYNSNTAVVKQDFAVVKQVDGRAAHMIDRHNSAPELAEHPPPPTGSCWIHPWSDGKWILFKATNFHVQLALRASGQKSKVTPLCPLEKFWN